ncbi:MULTISPECIES: chemotaxis protein CheA [Bacillaceae]|uniref:chemotaxis protein CheA n=1 Tax=Bacillaceae TaxID=186817 RepID=UPI002FFF92AD
MDFNNYRELFIEESKEHLQAINDQLLKLEAEPENIPIINEIFRSAHTLKGMAASMGFEDLASLTHEMENVLDLLRNDKLSINEEIMDVIFMCVDLIAKMVDNIELGGEGKENVTDIVVKLKQIQDPSFSAPTEQAAAKDEVAAAVEMVVDEYQLAVINEAKKIGNHAFQITVQLSENCVMKSVRAFMVFQALEDLGEVIQTEPSVELIEEDQFGNSFSILLLSELDEQKIKSPLLNISEVDAISISEKKTLESKPEIKAEAPAAKAKASSSQTSTATQAEQPDAKKKQRSKSIRVDSEKLDHLMNLFSELIIDRGRLEQIARRAQLTDLTETVEHMTRISTDLQGLILNMRMVPVEQVFNRFPRMVRDLARELNKKVNLVVEGAETELDRTVIDEIGDPLVHLLRNALDHGLESTEDRIANNKPEEGTVLLKAYHSGNHVFIEVIDDGAGINRDKVLSKAIERGVVKQEEADLLLDQQVYELILSSGFSTADKISDISGRGVGLDVVKSKIESLGGTISIDSTLGKGSAFRVQLPLTLSIIYSMLVKVQKETYAVPFNSIVEITTVGKDEVSLLHGQKVIQFRGHVVPLVFLNDVFHVPQVESNSEKHQLYVVIVRKGDKTMGLVVDTVLGQQEIVLKPLGRYLNQLYAISGATILGDGEVALIIDTNQFFV